MLHECQESIAGIIAGRVRDRYYKPAIVLTEGKHGAKGSARSIDGYNLFEELCKCSDLLSKFGGHTLAAGLSLETENIEKLSIMLNENCTLSDNDMMQKVLIDGIVPLSLLNENMVNELDLLEPFGKGNRKPLLAMKNLKVKKMMLIGKNKNYLKFDFIDSNYFSFTALAFQNCDEIQSVRASCRERGKAMI